MNKEGENPEISIIIPCLNEEKALSLCLDEIKNTLDINKLDAEIIFVDNGSTDKSLEIAKNKIVEISYLRIFEEKEKGYGSAYLKGLSEVKGKYIFIADSDCSYEFSDIPRFINKLKEGNDLVIGNRFMNKISNKSMPWHHKYIGNPLFSFVIKKIFKINIGDIHCGARAFKAEILKRITLHTLGMEFASEMIIKAAKAKLKIIEIPIQYRERIGESKLNSIGDGWRHLRFILLYSPIYLFLIPGIILFVIGFLSLLIFYFTSIKIFGIALYIHPMFFASVLTIVGYQIIFFAGFARIYAINHLGETDHFLERLFKMITIETAGFTGILISAFGAFIYIYISVKWINSGLGSLNEIKNSIIALTAIVIGIQTFFSAFMLSTLSINRKN